MRWLYGLFLLIPAAVVLEAAQAPAAWVFGAAALAIVPLSAVLGRATEELAWHTGPTVGGLLNATLGNAAELIITILAVRAGLLDLVKASLTGSILGNLLLILGLALLLGGVRHQTQSFNARAAGVAAAMLMLAVVGLVLPALFAMTHPRGGGGATLRLSIAVAAVLIVVYGVSLLFTLHTHKRLLGPAGEVAEVEEGAWSVKRALSYLLLATAGVALMSEILVSATEEAISALGVTELFVGVIVIPLIGNAAEHAAAVWMAAKNKMDLALGIAIGSSTQVALLVAPVLVFVALAFGQPMDFVFTSLEVVAVALATGIITIISLDGESHWFEGVQLLAVYLFLAVTFYFY
ncbi:MAG: calcium/proton exchanger [Gemmatimonadetes bacterium]|nr:calcium/proton exchanger [Gemmatimonadota bacterium]